MEILFLSTWYPQPPDNGSKLRVYYLLQALGQAHEVSLLSFDFVTTGSAETAALARYCRNVEIVAINPFLANQGGLLRTFLSPSPLVVRSIPAMRRTTTRCLESKSFDAVIASTEMMATYALQVSSGVAKVLEEHNSFTRWMKNRFLDQIRPLDRLRSWVSWQKTRYYEARLFNRFDLVTMVSGQDHATTRGLPGYHGRSEIVPNGVDCIHNRPGLKHHQREHLVFNGSLTYSANYDAIQWFLALIWPRIRAEVRDASLIITGSTVGVDLNGLMLNESVHFTGYVEDVRIPVAEAAIAIAPIRQGGGTRLKILEAMALATPVVATSKGAEGLDVVDGEHLLLADTPDAFANAVVRLLQDVNLSHQLSVNARRLVEARYDWESIGQRFVSHVEETVERKRATK